MSTVDDRPAGDTERQLAAYFTWLEGELGPLTASAVAMTPGRSRRTWCWVAAAAAVLALLGGLVITVGDDGAETVPASPTGDLRDVAGWFELDLPGVEVVESLTTEAMPIPTGPGERYYVWADLDGDPIRAMSAYFPAGDVPLDLDDDIDPPARIDDAPSGEAWVVDDPAAGANLLRVQWTRPDGSVVLASGTGVDAATLADWTFALGADDRRPPAAPDPSLALVLDSSTVEQSAGYQENWVVDGADVSVWVGTGSPAIWLGLGYPTVARVTVDGRDGYRFGGGRDDQAVLVTFPLRNGYWGHLSVPAERATDIVDHIVVVDDRVPTPDEVTGAADDEGTDPPDLASTWDAVVAEELESAAPGLTVDLTTASETYPVGAVATVPFDAGGRLRVVLSVWAAGEDADEASWLEATGATRFGTSFPEGAVYSETGDGRDRVGIVTEHGVVELRVELPSVGGLVRPPLTDLDDPDVFDEAVGLVRRLATRVPDVVASAGLDADAGIVCGDACATGQRSARLRIPAIGVDVAVAIAGDPADDGRGGSGVAPGSAPIGSSGVFRIWGGRSAWGTSFVDLAELDPGHLIGLVLPGGTAVTYVVESVAVVEPRAPVAEADSPTLLLSTADAANGRELRVTARACTACRGAELAEGTLVQDGP